MGTARTIWTLKFACIFLVTMLLQSFRIPYNPLPSMRRRVQSFSLLPKGVYPQILSTDTENSVAVVKVCISGENTRSAFQEACRKFNAEASALSGNLPNASVGVNMTEDALYRVFGEKKIKQFSLQYLSPDIAAQCNNTGLVLVGSGTIVDFRAEDYIPGQALELTVNCSLMPQITYQGEGGGGEGYKRLRVTLPSLSEQYQRLVRERYRLIVTDPQYGAQEEDAVLVDLRGHLIDEEGGRGEAVESMTNPELNVVLSPSRTHPQLVKALLGCTTGQQLTTELSFEGATEGPAAVLQGKRTSVDIKVLGISILPAWGESLARAIHPQLNLTDLDRQTEEEAARGAEEGLNLLRNEALAAELLKTASTTKIPEVLVSDALSAMYVEHLTSLRNAGVNDSSISAIRRVKEFRAANQKRAERAVKLSLVLHDIARREGIRATDKTVDQAVQHLVRQYKENNQTVSEFDPILRREVEDSLSKLAVFDYLATVSKM